MTAKEKGATAARKKRLPLSEIMIIAAFLIMLKMSDTVRRGTWSGLVLTAGTILPSVFPFMVLGDFLSYCISRNGLGTAGVVISRIFGVGKSEVGILVSGLLCGFPSSARAAAEAYKNGNTDKSSAIKLAAISSNPSPPFIIGAVGAGLSGSTLIGGLLFISLLFSVVITSAVFGKNRQKSTFPDIIPEQKYSFVASVKNAGQASITVFSFVALFCALIEILKSFIGCGVFFSIAVSALEVSTAVTHLLADTAFPPHILYSLLGFSIGFGGLCANLQCAAFLSDAGLELKKFFLIKLISGVVCALVTAALTPILILL